MGIQYDSVNNQVVFSGDTYVKRSGAGAVQLGNATTGVVISDHALITAISAPATPSAGTGRLYAAGASGSEELYWLNSGGSAKSLSAPTPPSGDTKVIYNDGGAWAAANVYYTKANGYFGVGQASPGERLHLKDGSGNGAVVLGAHQNATAIAGTVEWTGTLLRWYDGSNWKNIGIDLTDPLLYKGVIPCAANPNYPAADAGHTYRISEAGKIGGASGPAVEVGDMIICTEDGTASGDHAAVGSKWDIIQANLDGAVIGPASATDTAVALFSGTTGKLIKNSLVTIDGSGSVNIPSSQSYKINGSALTYANVGAEPTLPLSTRGDLLYRNASNATARLPVGTSGQVITTDGTDVSWGAVPGRHDAVTLATSATTGGLGLSTQQITFQAATSSQNGYLTSTDWSTFNGKVSGAAGTTGQIQFCSPTSTFGSDAALHWDNTEKRFGVGTASPSTAFHVLDGNNEGLRVETSNCAYIEVGQTGGNRWRWTSLYSGADRFELTIGTGGAVPATSLWTVDTAGKLGIGGAPQATLDVQATSAWIRAMGSTNPYISAQDTTNTCVVKMQALDSAAYLGTQSDHEVRFIVNNAAKAYLTTTGRLGINVAAPSYILHTSVDGRGDVQFDSHSASDDGTFLWLRRSGGTQASPAAVPSGHRLGNIAFAGYYDTSNSSWGAVIQSMAYGLWSATNRGACLQFYTTTTGTTALTERMRIIDNGYVGIGATTPDAKLQVNTWIENNTVGNTPTVLFWGNVPHSTSSETVLRLHRPLASGLSYGGGADFNIYRYGAGSVSPYTQMDIALKSASSYVQTATVNVISMRDTGNVGIGNTTPDVLLTLGTAGTKAGAVSLAGATSGVVTVQVAAAAGTWSLTLPITGGTNGYFLQTNGSGVTTWAAALTSVTAHNLLSTTHGDTLAETVVRGDILYGNATPKWARLAFPASPTGKVLQATATDVAWSTSALGTAAFTATGDYATAAQGTLATNALPKSGGTMTGAIVMQGSSSGTCTIQVAAAAGTGTIFQLPVTNGTNGYFLQTNGSGVTTWAAASASPAGSNSYVQFNSSSAFGADDSFRWDNTGKQLILGKVGQLGKMQFTGSTSGVVTVDVAATAGTWAMTLPTTGGTSGYFLQTNGSGVTTWAAATATAAGTSGCVQFNGNANAFAGVTNLLWDNTNFRLYVGASGSTAPTSTLHVKGSNSASSVGTEKVTNGTFTGGTTGWTLGTGWAYGTNNVIATVATASGTLTQSITFAATTFFRVSWKQTHSSERNGSVKCTISADDSGEVIANAITVTDIGATIYVNTGGTYSLTFTVTNRTGTGTITLDDISVKQIYLAGDVAHFEGVSDAQLRVTSSSSIGFGRTAIHCSSGSGLAAYGQNALRLLVESNINTAFGDSAGTRLSYGTGNVLVGYRAAYSARTLQTSTILGSSSAMSLVYALGTVGVGQNVLGVVIQSLQDTAIGSSCMYGAASSTSSANAAVGSQILSTAALMEGNACLGFGCLRNVSGDAKYTVAVGYEAGKLLTSGADNTSSYFSIYLGGATRASVAGNSNEIVIGYGASGNGSNTTTIGHTDIVSIYLRGDIYSNKAYAKAVGGTNRAAYVDNTGLIGTISSSLRTKQDVVDMEDVGWIDRLRPVNFCYRSTPGVKQYGLIAEEVEGVNRDLVGYDWEGLPDSVNYDRLVPVLLKAVRELRHEMAQMKLAMLP